MLICGQEIGAALTATPDDPSGALSINPNHWLAVNWLAAFQFRFNLVVAISLCSGWVVAYAGQAVRSTNVTQHSCVPPSTPTLIRAAQHRNLGSHRHTPPQLLWCLSSFDWDLWVVL